MAGREQDREDLLREATALVERVELDVPGFPGPIVVGFRRDGAASFFFGADFVLQFNTAGALRRGYDRGTLLKAEGGRLIALSRQRTAQQVQLVRHSLDTHQTQDWLAAAATALADVERSLEAGNYRLVGQVPAQATVVPRVRQWLATRGPLQIAQRPHAS